MSRTKVLMCILLVKRILWNLVEVYTVDILLSIELYERSYLISMYREGEILNLVKLTVFSSY